ncbi:hypothetical protein BC827DRAFT_1203751 [Russula dissimulans]|jgi:hypothetical protein|nr:hypothetical protein BC827DRAFT_1203751 [Russula dissimulans]
MISETAHLIWVLRCKRNTQEKRNPIEEIRARWLKAINARLTNDKITATKVKRDKNFSRLAENTWEQVLRKEGDIPENWLFHCEVLVGRRTPPPLRAAP